MMWRRMGGVAAALAMLSCVHAAEDGGAISFPGVGLIVSIERDDAGETVARVVGLSADSPGGEAGMKAGDAITHIDGNAVAGMEPAEVARRLRGRPGTKVTLTLAREGAAPVDVEVTRRAPVPGEGGNLERERAEGIARVGHGPGPMNFTIAVGGPDGRVQVLGPGMMRPGEVDMVATDTHVYVLRGTMLSRFKAEDMSKVWERDLRTPEEQEAAKRHIILAGVRPTAKLIVAGPYLYALCNYMLYQFRLEDMEELGAVDLRTPEERERMKRALAVEPPRIHVRP
ncbi:MAG: PDZ domain-containing protein [Armatimonadetes bacterium]|nr:PDZ domain-containing protein [Armatimonadota bacterium]